MVQFGPADYSMSIGIPGQWNHPRVKEAQEYMIKTAIKMGVAPRVELMDFKDAGALPENGGQTFLHRVGCVHHPKILPGAGRGLSKGLRAFGR